MSKMNIRTVKIILVIIFTLALLIYSAPASLVSDPIKDVKIPVTLSGFQGRLVSGQVEQLQYQNLVYEQLSWQLNPLSLISGTASGSIQLEDRKARLKADLVLQDQRVWQIDNLNGQVQLAPIADTLAIFKLFQIAGYIEFEEIFLAQNMDAFSNASGDLHWQDARISVNNLEFELGTVDAVLSTDGTELFIDFNATQGLTPQGRLALTTKGDYKIQFSIDPNSLNNQSKWLAQMGKTNPDGRVAYSMNGRFR